MTIDGISAEAIIKLSNNLKSNKHKYSTLRRVDIPKSNKPDETRTLLIASPRDKIIQQAFKRVLEIILEGVAAIEEVDEKHIAKHEHICLECTLIESATIVRRSILPTLDRRE